MFSIKDHGVIFQTGEMLSDKEKKKPTVSVFPVSNEQAKKKHVMLCQAQGMFPDLVKFTWKDPSGGIVQASEGNDELLEQKDDQENWITSMLIVDQSKVKSYGYTCLVDHETGQTSISIPKETEAVAATCPPPQKARQEGEKKEENIISGLFELRRSLYLFSVTYVMLLVKNVLYFCTISVLLYKRYSANKEMLRGKVR